MINPKTPLQAATIFLGGTAVIAWTSLDVYRVSKQNEQVLTPQQLKELQDFGNDVRRQATGIGSLRTTDIVLQKLSFFCAFWGNSSAHHHSPFRESIHFLPAVNSLDNLSRTPNGRDQK